mmetsp:Transcript_234/g.448  ORF Transcript_234/g.448 Transcript_234/m.448 type:complete len:234 (-) Transcript_234:1334-2035(-)
MNPFFSRSQYSRFWLSSPMQSFNTGSAAESINLIKADTDPDCTTKCRGFTSCHSNCEHFTSTPNAPPSHFDRSDIRSQSMPSSHSPSSALNKAVLHSEATKPKSCIVDRASLGLLAHWKALATLASIWYTLSSKLSYVLLPGFRCSCCTTAPSKCRLTPEVLRSTAYGTGLMRKRIEEYLCPSCFSGVTRLAPCCSNKATSASAPLATAPRSAVRLPSVVQAFTFAPSFSNDS